MLGLGFIKFKLFQKKYRFLNKHNSTQIMNFCDLSKISVGRKSYGQICVTDWSPRDTKLCIGNYCSIAPNVKFLLGGEHTTKSISTFPFKTKVFGVPREAGSKGDIVVKDDAWIGEGAIICSGITIGQGAVIAAGSVVTKNVDSYAIVGGNPAKFIKWRFDENCRRKLCAISVTNLFDSITEKDIPLFYEDLNKEVLNKILEKKNVLLK